MSDQERISYEPMTTVEIDCATSAKGDVNVSWRVKVQVPTIGIAVGLAGDAKINELMDNVEYLAASTSQRAALSKRRYQDQLLNVSAAQADLDQIALDEVKASE